MKALILMSIAVFATVSIFAQTTPKDTAVDWQNGIESCNMVFRPDTSTMYYGDKLHSQTNWIC